ncbi:MAG: toll/interleukin-1 receptor domain-containing protein, partial [Clostridiales bacterium]|nr:toll/interleukin-1 receptor domain-containing protein [Clostridiales bacterium]
PHGWLVELKVLFFSVSLDLFFSYGHDRNRFLVERIRRDLEKRGHHVWIDTNEIKAGDHWRNDILNGILKASSVIAFLSEHSTRDPGVCLDELKIAVCVKGADIKTVLLEPENRIRPPSTLSEIQWLDMSDWYERKMRSDPN